MGHLTTGSHSLAAGVSLHNRPHVRTVRWRYEEPLIPIAAMMPFLIWRLLAEERFLARNLPGYDEYQKRVRHRLVPFVW